MARNNISGCAYPTFLALIGLSFITYHLIKPSEEQTQEQERADWNDQRTEQQNDRYARQHETNDRVNGIDASAQAAMNTSTTTQQNKENHNNNDQTNNDQTSSAVSAVFYDVNMYSAITGGKTRTAVVAGKTLTQEISETWDKLTIKSTYIPTIKDTIRSEHDSSSYVKDIPDEKNAIDTICTYVDADRSKIIGDISTDYFIKEIKSNGQNRFLVVTTDSVINHLDPANPQTYLAMDKDTVSQRIVHTARTQLKKNITAQYQHLLDQFSKQAEAVIKELK